MPELINRAIRRRHHGPLEDIIRIDFASVGVQLTPDGKVTVLGFVHQYLGGWSARATEGLVRPPCGWPEVIYEYVPGHLALPVISTESGRIKATLRRLLKQPNVLKRTSQ
jgi:hypothetical protein